MNTTLDRYNNGFDPKTVKELKSINEKIEKETDSEELLKLKMQRLNLGFDINAGVIGRVRGGYYPY